MSFRLFSFLLSLVIMIGLVACSAEAPRAAPAWKAPTTALCTELPQLPVAQLTLSDQGAENLLCGPCRPRFDCHCGEDFCTRSDLPCP